MNIFATSPNAVQSAIWLDDKRVGKMIMEANQMLTQAVKCRFHKDYWEQHIHTTCLTVGSAYANHPCTLWARESAANFRWLYFHAIALADEFYFRFNKTHASSLRTDNIWKLYVSLCPVDELSSANPTLFVNCAANSSLDLSFKHIPDVHEAYQLYLKERFKTDLRKPKWTKRVPPHWAEVKFNGVDLDVLYIDEANV
jgi:hypothetical protein